MERKLCIGGKKIVLGWRVNATRVNIVSTKVTLVRNKISLSLMINANVLLAPSRRLIFGGPVITLRLTRKTVSSVK